MSLTKALNNACNRAVRRILLAKSWPSEEAFNLSLRLAANAEKKQQQLSSSYEDTKRQDSKVCPVPRPILNMLKTSSKSSSNSDTITSPSSKSGVSGMASSTGSFKKTRTNEEYVKDQVNAFRNRYGKISGYNDAEALLESILSLATTGEESIRVNEVRKLQLICIDSDVVACHRCDLKTFLFFGQKKKKTPIKSFIEVYMDLFIILSVKFEHTYFLTHIK